jgi:hypothetical protein
MQALLGLAEGARTLGLHVEAVGAAVHLRRPHLHELAQQRLSTGRVDGALQASVARTPAGKALAWSIRAGSTVMFAAPPAQTMR